jgi:hypothetical protein
MVKGTGNLNVVPALGAAVDLAERKEFLEPMRARIILLPIVSGTMLHDKRLGPPAILGSSFMWMVAEEDIASADPPFIIPTFENLI